MCSAYHAFCAWFCVCVCVCVCVCLWCMWVVGGERGQDLLAKICGKSRVCVRANPCARARVWEEIAADHTTITIMPCGCRHAALLAMLLVEGGRSQHREWSFAQQAAAAGDSHRMLHFAAATLAADPSFVPAAILRSEALGEVGRLNEAMEGFESALKLQPRSADIYAKMGNTFRRGAYWSANSLSKKDNGPDGADAVNVRARWWKLALESMRTATLLDPRNAECYAGLADMLSMQARRRDDPRADAPHGGSSKEGIAAAEGEAAAARAHAVQLFSEALIQDRRAGAPGHQGDDRKFAHRLRSCGHIVWSTVARRRRSSCRNRGVDVSMYPSRRK